eukprot:GSChrysophyteH1.ASY1.ANO1.70.1 assembled CDS
MSAEERAHPRWAEIWNGGLEPGQAFDAKTPSPCLVNEIKNGRIPNGKALVPGCGRGYDVLALATKERKVLGIDLAEKAVEAASKLNDTCEYRENASFEVGDVSLFFALSETSSYDFIYDYTFLCALHPSVQQQWATKMTELVRPGGLLLTLVFPICEKDGGPPYAMSLELVERLLTTGEMTGKWHKEKLEILPPELSHRGRDGTSDKFGANEKSLITPETMPKGAVYSGIGRWVRV